jgi:hypothetical protein
MTMRSFVGIGFSQAAVYTLERARTAAKNRQGDRQGEPVSDPLLPVLPAGSYLLSKNQTE